MNLPTDKWGRDPAVQRMRRLFSAMEAAQAEWVRSIGIDTFDAGLRGIRETARDAFERSFSAASAKGLRVDENASLQLYRNCLAASLSRAGVLVPDHLVPDPGPFTDLIKEVMP